PRRDDPGGVRRPRPEGTSLTGTTIAKVPVSREPLPTLDTRSASEGLAPLLGRGGTHMRRALVAPLLFLALGTFAATAEAAPTAALALECYQSALQMRGYSLEHQGVYFETLEGE